MTLPPTLKSAVARLGRVERVFVVLLLVYLLLALVAPSSAWTALIQVAAIVCGLWAAIRLIRVSSRRVIWRLRNRLIVTYLFIAFVPVLLILVLAGLAGWAMISQVSVYLVTSELDRRVESLKQATDSLVKTSPQDRAAVVRGMSDLFYRDHFPGLRIVVDSNSRTLTYPENSGLKPPPDGWGDTAGVVLKDGQFWIWSHAKLTDGNVTAMAPLTREYLAGLVPHIGVVRFLYLRDVAPGKGSSVVIGGRNVEVVPQSADQRQELPPAAGAYDIEVGFASFIPVAVWQSPGAMDHALLRVRSRPSAVLGVLMSRKSDFVQAALPILLFAVALLFLIVELVSLIIGVTMTRTITRAVHHLYDGTQRVMHGDFSHRIEVSGRDQLAELSDSFNSMTGRLQELIQVAKEKERLQSEIEIAREVQNQLYPRQAPSVRSLRITALCKPARMVSGDYFDYECVHEDKLALAIGDVAGKGISAALLMATLQSSLRTELRNSLEFAVAAGNGARISPISTARLVSHLNQHLYAYTSPEKYATFCLGVYDNATGELKYTNAGHLPPVLLRNGEPIRLNVDGTVVGAFAFAEYDESCTALNSGDLLVCFTDGVTEPENAYGEMFGEDRLIDLIARNAHRNDDQIVELVIQAVEQWTGSPELQDDLTLLLARRQ